MTAESSQARPRGIIGLDLIRFVAAFVVVMFHLAYWSTVPGEITHRASSGLVSLPGWAAFTAFGWVGVEIFFVLSGFVIAYSAQGSAPFDFLKRRILRLVPAVWVCATITLAAILFAGLGDGYLKVYLWTLAMVPFGKWIDPVYWTLFVEIFFYAAVLGLLMFGGFRHIRLFAVALGSVSTVFWIAVSLGEPGSALANLERSWLCALLLLRHGCFFGLGCILWMLTLGRVETGRVWLHAVALVCIVGCGLEIASVNEVRNAIGLIRIAPIVPIGFWLVFIGAIVASVRYNDAAYDLVGAARGAAVVRKIGLMTYPLYLVHDIVGGVVMAQIRLAGGSSLTALIIATVGVVAIAYLVVLIEPSIRKPMNALLDAAARRASLRSREA